MFNIFARFQNVPNIARCKAIEMRSSPIGKISLETARKTRFESAMVFVNMHLYIIISHQLIPYIFDVVNTDGSSTNKSHLNYEEEDSVTSNRKCNCEIRRKGDEKI